MSVLTAFTQAELLQFATNWYRKLDVHEPLEQYIPLLAETGVEMRFPEATVYGFEGFQDWYERVITIFFDEEHTVKSVEILSQTDGKAEVKVVVNWQASMWNPPAPYSQRIILDAYQTWIVQRSSKTDAPVILTYIVDSLEYAEGSAKL